MTWLRFFICAVAPIGVASIIVSVMRAEWVFFADLSAETQAVTVGCAAVMILDALLGVHPDKEPSE